MERTAASIAEMIKRSEELDADLEDSREYLAARSVQHDTLAGYRDAKTFGSLAAIYNAAGRRDPRALAILAGMQSDANGESNGYGFQACISAALKGAPYAAIRVDPVTVADIV